MTENKVRAAYGLQYQEASRRICATGSSPLQSPVLECCQNTLISARQLRSDLPPSTLLDSHDSCLYSVRSHWSEVAAANAMSVGAPTNGALLRCQQTVSVSKGRSVVESDRPAHLHGDRYLVDRLSE